MNRPTGDTIFNSLRRVFGAAALADAEDQELLEQFAVHQNEAAFAALLRRHGPMVWGVCQRLVPHRQDAEDCFQATFLVLCRKAGSIGRADQLANWLFGVARRAALNAQAQRARRARHEATCPALPDVPGAAPAPWDDTPSVLDEELARLPARYRQPLLLCGLEGMTHAQAGKSLGWPVGTVAGRLSRGRELLRSRLQRRGVMAPGAVLPALLVADSAPACVPAQLASASVRSAVAMFMAGQSAPPDISATVAALVRGVLNKMFVHRVLTQSVLAAVAALALGSAAETWQHRLRAETPAPASIRSDLFAPSRGQVVSQASDNPAIHLPADPNAVVLSMDRSVDSSLLPGVSLTIFADGRVVAQVPEGLHSLSAQTLTEFVRDYASQEKDRKAPRIRLLEGRIPRAELEELVRFAVQEQEFFTLDAVSIKAEIGEEYQSDWAVHDAKDETTTTFTVQTADKKHTVAWSKLIRSIWDFPGIQPLRQLQGLDQKLTHVYYVLLAGGPQRVDAVAEALDSLLQPFYAKHPLAPRLAAEDLAGVNLSTDGSAVQYIFSRSTVNFELLPQFAVTINVPHQGQPYLYSAIPLQ
jgi:RNA polymerase sigma factor (sigma-70 family)